MSTISFANPRQFPEYERILHVKFASVADADRATLSLRSLPPGKQYAFSLRWDDANPRHLCQKAAFGPNGFRATFMIDGPVMKPLSRELMRGGCSIGNHSLTHPFLNFCELNEIFRQVMEQKALLESYLNCVITPFAMPCGWDYGPAKTQLRGPFLKLLGRILRDTGHLGSADGGVDTAALYGMDESHWFSPKALSIGDSDPKPALFWNALKEFQEQESKQPGPWGPLFILGVHSWQSDEGFQRLAKEVYAPLGGRKDWWYCNLTEYFAHRYQYLHAHVERVAQDGATVIWRIVGCGAQDLGDEIPMTLECSATIQAVDCPTATAALQKNCILLSQDEQHSLPVRIEFLSSDAMASEQGIQIQMTYDASHNQIIAMWKAPNVEAGECPATAILRIPPAYRLGMIRQDFDLTQKAGTLVFSLGEMSDFPFANDGDHSFYLQIDYRSNKQSRRVYAKLVIPASSSGSGDSPREAIAVLGTIDASRKIPEEYFTKMSTPGTFLEPLGKKPYEQWHAIQREHLCRFAVHPYSSVSGWEVPHDDADWVQNLYVLDFLSDTEQIVQIFHFPPQGRLFMNGQELSMEPKALFTAGKARAGINRVLLLLKQQAWNTLGGLAVSKTENPYVYLPCVVPQGRQ